MQGAHTVAHTLRAVSIFHNVPYALHFLRNALDYVPRRVDDDCLQELRWLYDRRDLAEARRDLGAWLAKWSGKYPTLTGWVEETIDETLTFYRLPRQHHKHLKSTNMP
jgi:transposase-like protein